MKMKKFLTITILLLGLGFLSCKKDKNNEAPASCSKKSGSFEITADGNTYTLQLDDETQYTIVYGWYFEGGNEWAINGKDQNDNWLYLECVLPGKLPKGTHDFNVNTSEFFFSISLDPKGFSSTEMTFEIVESKFDSQNGVYKPISGTFSGVGIQSTESFSQDPPDTIQFSGKFCLNEVIL